MPDKPILSIGSKGDPVRRLQEALAQAGFSPGGADGVFGAHTESAVRAFQQAKHLTVDGVVGPQTWAALETAAPGPAVALGVVDDGVRGQIVAHALWGVTNEAQIHYRQIRPIAGIGDVHELPLTTDCSGFATLCYNWAGAPDPNGFGYNGLGYTGTMLNHLDRINPGDAEPGDLIVIGPGSGDHVVVIVEPGSDPMVVGHGRESGPSRQRLSSDSREPKRFLRSRANLSAVFDQGDGTNEQVTIPVDLASATNAPEE